MEILECIKVSIDIKTMSSADSDNLTYFPICFPVLTFSCLIALATAQNTMLKGKEEELAFPHS